MCNFLSALVLRNGDVLTHSMLDSHSDLVSYYKLPDDRAHHQHFAKVELTPVDWLDVTTWIFRLDEHTAPGWWGDVGGQADTTLRDRAQRMMLTTGRTKLIADGCWIAAGDAVIDAVVAGRVVYLGGSAQVGVMRESAKVGEMWGSASVGVMRESASVGVMRESAKVGEMRESANVGADYRKKP